MGGPLAFQGTARLLNGTSAAYFPGGRGMVFVWGKGLRRVGHSLTLDLGQFTSRKPEARLANDTDFMDHAGTLGVNVLTMALRSKKKATCWRS